MPWVVFYILTQKICGCKYFKADFNQNYSQIEVILGIKTSTDNWKFSEGLLIPTPTIELPEVKRYAMKNAVL
jgi:hypothetical protein